MKNVCETNRIIEKALTLEYFDNGKELSKLYALAKSVYDKSLENLLKNLNKTNMLLMNEYIIPDEIIQLGDNVRHLEYKILELNNFKNIDGSEHNNILEDSKNK